MNEKPMPSGVRTPRVVLNPNFFDALRAAWMFTWRSQLSLTKLPLSFLGILALPVLIFLMTQSPDAWAIKHRPKMGNAPGYLSGFSKKLTAAGLATMEPNLKARALKIVADEYSRTEQAWGSVEERLLSTAKLQEDIRSTHARIKARVQPLLDEKVFAEFVEFQKPKFNNPPVISDNSEWNRTGPFYHLLIDLYFFMVLPLSCVRMCGSVIRDELENDTLGFLTTRPIKRATLILVKFISATAWLQIWMLLQTAIVFAVGHFRQVPDLEKLIPLFIGTQVLAVCAWSALGLFLGMFSKRYMPLALLYGGVIENGIGRIPTNINTLSMMRHMKALLGHNVELDALYSWPDVSTAIPISVLVLAVPFFVILAALFFTFREYQHTNEVQK